MNLEEKNKLLLVAAGWGEKDKVEKYLAEGCNPNHKNAHGETVLYRAAQYGDMDCVQLLLNKGAAVAARTESEQTLLHAAVCSGSFGFGHFVCHQRSLCLCAGL
eukprot:TRINITY_DN4397_c0_g1_i1.p1 TRINITY_DN4397_c0_g1~~TRINITY_DN4397_c0_g1_i1.p1  ORF type:complete len:104 (+),score=17.77 TRINITY_DN4397_c0_g1_i1:132-443(+)